MTFNRTWKTVALACAIVSGGLAGAPARAFAGQQVAPDNTKVNERDRQPHQKTADQQANDRTDMETTRQIRKALVADKSLSTSAHNVKIITVAGKVTLKGPVRTSAEKSAVIDKANEVAGPANVTSQLSVTGKPTTHRKSSTR